MKRMIGFVLLMMSIEFGNAQAANIGIGTGTPGARLQINHKNNVSSPALTLFDSAAGSGSKLLFSKQNQGNSFSLLSNIDVLAANSTFDIRTTFNSGILLKGNGMVGINNVINPLATLHVGGGVKVQDSLHVNKGVTVDDTLHVGGDVNLEGALKVNGSAGNANQILISGGTGASPSWVNIAQIAGGKFFVPIAANNQATGRQGFSATIPAYNQDDTMDFASNDGYNIGADFTLHTDGLVNNNITINTTGLYHLEGLVDFYLNEGGVPNTQPNSSVFLVVVPPSGIPSKMKIRARDIMTREFAEDVFVGGHPFQISRYFVANTKLILMAEYQNLNSYPLISIGVTGSGYFSGYKISD